MIRELKDSRQGPDQADSVVLFLHGYGADGADLLGLAGPLGAHLKGTAFRAPDAPEKCRGNPFGYQWFPISWLDGTPEAEMQAGFERSKADLHAYLDRVLEEEGITADRLALVGFSQGTMMSLAVGPERTQELAGIVGFSGRLVDPEGPAKAETRPPVLLVHGDQDPMVPFASMGEAGKALAEAGFEVYGHVMEGTGHGIAPDGLSVALTFLKDRLERA